MQAKPDNPPPLDRTVDADDVARFSRIADEWWDEKGKFKPLHRINPLRIGYIRDHIAAHYNRPLSLSVLSGLSLLDIGCGGGLISEPMARLGAQVTGVDASEKNIAVAALHAQKMGLAIAYEAGNAEMLAHAGRQFDIVLALEIVEHVADVPVFLAALGALVKPGGMLFMSTLNRTMKSYALAIIGAEYVLRWLPRGTHQWKQFVRPSELMTQLARHGLDTGNISGMVMHPLTQQWRLSPDDLSVNYVLCAKKSA